MAGMPRQSEPFRLRPRDRTQLQWMLHSGGQQVRVVLRVLAVSQLDRGVLAPEVARTADLTPAAIRRIGRRYQAGGVARTVFDVARPGAAEGMRIRNRRISRARLRITSRRNRPTVCLKKGRNRCVSLSPVGRSALGSVLQVDNGRQIGGTPSDHHRLTVGSVVAVEMFCWPSLLWRMVCTPLRMLDDLA